MNHREVMQQALEALEGELPGWRTPAQERAITALRAALARHHDDVAIANPRGGGVIYKTSAATTDAAIRAKLVELGWTPPTALAQQEQAVRDALTTGTGVLLGGERIDPASVYKQQEQEQEPVARVIDDETPEGSTEWIPYSGRQVPVKTGDLLYPHPPRRETEQEPVAWIQPDHLQKARQAPFLCRVEPTKRMSDFVPIYTAPPRREWRSLSEKEIGDVFYAARNAKLGAANDNSRHRLSVVEIARAVEQALKEKKQ
jgi:hypothetical protein